MKEQIKTIAKRLLQEASGRRFIYRMRSDSNVFFTFDDGPHPEHTPAVLETLERAGVKATFFLIGEQVERHPEIVRQMEQAGHTIGLHTHTHITLDQLDDHSFAREMEANEAAIEAAIGHRPTLLRPPKGQINFAALRRAFARGLQVVHYTITSNDWCAESSEDVTRAVAPDRLRGGEIVSFHDTIPHTVQALPQLLETIRERSLSCARVA